MLVLGKSWTTSGLITVSFVYLKQLRALGVLLLYEYVAEVGHNVRWLECWPGRERRRGAHCGVCCEGGAGVVDDVLWVNTDWTAGRV